MKLFFVILLGALALWAADPQARRKRTPRAPQAPAAAAPQATTPQGTAAPQSTAAPQLTDASKPAAIPAGAVKEADGDYHYTDPQGKKWIYIKTPFGVAHIEDTPEHTAAQSALASVPGIKATEYGDTVRFERLGPFGLWKWEKKKSELDETEKAALRNSQADKKIVSKQD